jgi:hypothetical protein
MEKQLNQSANPTCMIVVETFEAVSETERSIMWFTPGLRIFATLDEPGDTVGFTSENSTFTVSRDAIAAHCRPYRSSLAASSQ